MANPYRDRKGQFASGPGGGRGAAKAPKTIKRSSLTVGPEAAKKFNRSLGVSRDVPETNMAGVQAIRQFNRTRRLREAAQSRGLGSGSSGGVKVARQGKPANYAGMDYKGKEGKSFVVSDGIRTKYLNNQEFGDFSRQKLGFTGGKSSGAVTRQSRPKKAKSRSKKAKG